MSDDRFTRLQQLTLRALELPPEARAAFLEAECEDAEMRQQVERLLEHEHEHWTILDRDPAPSLPSGPETADPAQQEARRLIGQQVEHYRIDSLLGSGGMGHVYRARDLKLDRDVALKFIRGENWADPRVRERFLREARAAAGLDHPAICTVHGTGEYGGQPFLDMAYLEGETVKDKIQRGPLPILEALEIARQIATGLEAAHAKDLIHRDIKSSNIMVSPDGTARILDFGLARNVGRTDISRTGEVLGTIAYMSPEQAEGKPVDHRADLWSLGVVLYEMLTGELPFGRGNQTTVLIAIVRDAPRPIPELQPAVPRGCAAILERALAKPVEGRYQSATEFRRDLEALCASPDLTHPGSTRRAHVRRRFRQAVIGFAVAIGIALAAWSAKLIADSVGSRSPLPRYQPRQVTTDQAWEGEPTLSPDGSRIAFTMATSGNDDIAVIDVGGGNPVVLCADPAEDNSPAWFPDGSRIAFTSMRSGHPAVWVTNQYGNGATLLVDHAADPAVSPDGKRIAFARSQPGGLYRIWVCPLDRPADSAKVSHEGDGPSNHLAPAWSPDGKRICYQTAGPIFVVPADGRSPCRALDIQGSSFFTPTWSPNGRSIYFASYREGTRALWRVSARGGRPQRLTIGSGFEDHPNLDRDGSRLAYATNREGKNLVVRNLETDTERGLSIFGEAVSPAISPDGRTVVFGSQRAGQFDDLWSVTLADGQASEPPRRLTNQEGHALLPTFSPDGRWIAYFVNSPSGSDVRVLPASGGAPTRLTPEASHAGHPTWSPDGRFLVFVRDLPGARTLCRLPVQDGRAVGEIEEIPAPGIRALSPAVSPDGRWVAFRGGFGNDVSLWLVPFDGSAPPRRIASGRNLILLRWPSDPGWLYASVSDGGTPPILEQISIPDGAERPLGVPVRFGATGTIACFDVARDAPWMVYGREETPEGDIWVLESEPGAF